MAIAKITPEEELEMWRFLLQNTENVGATVVWKRYKLASGSARPVQTLYNRFKYNMSPKLHTVELSVDEKAKLYRMCKIEVDPSYRDTLKEHGYQIDEQGFVMEEAEHVTEPVAEPVADQAAEPDAEPNVVPKKPKKRRSSSMWTNTRKKPRTRRSAGSEAVEAPKPAPEAPEAPKAPEQAEQASEEAPTPRASRARKSRETPPPRAPRPVRGAAEQTPAPTPAPEEAPITRRTSRARGSVKPEPVEVVAPVEQIEPVVPVESVEPVEQQPEPDEPVVIDIKPRITRSRAPAPEIQIIPAPSSASMKTRRSNQLSVKKILKTLEPVADSLAHKMLIQHALKQLKKDQKVSTENVRSVIDSALKILDF